MNPFFFVFVVFRLNIKFIDRKQKYKKKFRTTSESQSLRRHREHVYIHKKSKLYRVPFSFINKQRNTVVNTLAPKKKKKHRK